MRTHPIIALILLTLSINPLFAEVDSNAAANTTAAITTTATKSEPKQSSSTAKPSQSQDQNIETATKKRPSISQPTPTLDSNAQTKVMPKTQKSDSTPKKTVSKTQKSDSKPKETISKTQKSDEATKQTLLTKSQRVKISRPVARTTVDQTPANFTTGVYHHPQELTIYTFANPLLTTAWSGGVPAIRGTATQLISQALMGQGRAFRLVLSTPKQAIATAKSHPNTCVFPVVSRRNIHDELNLIAPVARLDFELAVAKDHPTFKGPLKQLKIGFAQNDGMSELLQQHGYQNLQVYPTVDAVLTALTTHKIDLALVHNLKASAHRHGRRLQDFQSIGTLFQQLPLYLACHPTVKLSESYA